MFDNSESQIPRVVRIEIFRGEVLNLRQQACVHHMRAGDQHIIETMLDRAMCIVLTRVAYLSSGALLIGIGVSFSGVIALARFSGPRTIGHGVKGPVGDIDTHYRID